MPLLFTRRVTRIEHDVPRAWLEGDTHIGLVLCRRQSIKRAVFDRRISPKAPSR